MEHILLVVQVIIAAALIGMVLIQRSDTDGFGMGSGGGGNLMSGRAKANLMTRTTAILAALFIINSLALSILAAHHTPSSILDTIDAQEATTTPKADVAAPEKKPGIVVEKSIIPEKKSDVKIEKESAVKDNTPSVPNADETKPAAKPVKKVKPSVDEGANAAKTSESESNE